MSRVRESIDIGVPVHVAYERLCHFEEYPHFMAGVQEVTQISADISHWIMDLDGAPAEFDARITNQRTDELLSWQAIDGPRLAETVTFHPLSEDRTRIIAELEMEAMALMPTEAYGEESLDRRLKADLDGFKQYIEADISWLASHNVIPANPTPGDGGVLGTARAGAGGFATRDDGGFATRHGRGSARNDGGFARYDGGFAQDDGGFAGRDDSRGASPGRRSGGGPAGDTPAGGRPGGGGPAADPSPGGRQANGGPAGGRQSNGRPAAGGARHGRKNGSGGRSGRH
jgi:ribosome-associated toxin RatA of RatAB toxin-antitoxin module